MVVDMDGGNANGGVIWMMWMLVMQMVVCEW